MRDGLNDDTGIVWGQLDPDFGGPRTNTITIEPYPNEKVVIDGTISIDVDWRPTIHNGHLYTKRLLIHLRLLIRSRDPLGMFMVFGSMADTRFHP